MNLSSFRPPIFFANSSLYYEIVLHIDTIYYSIDFYFVVLL